jgi:hypothetical protein
LDSAIDPAGKASVQLSGVPQNFPSGGIFLKVKGQALRQDPASSWIGRIFVSADPFPRIKINTPTLSFRRALPESIQSFSYQMEIELPCRQVNRWRDAAKMAQASDLSARTLFPKHRYRPGWKARHHASPSTVDPGAERIVDRKCDAGKEVAPIHARGRRRYASRI